MMSSHNHRTSSAVRKTPARSPAPTTVPRLEQQRTAARRSRRVTPTSLRQQRGAVTAGPRARARPCARAVERAAAARADGPGEALPAARAAIRPPWPGGPARCGVRCRAWCVRHGAAPHGEGGRAVGAGGGADGTGRSTEWRESTGQTTRLTTGQMPCRGATEWSETRPCRPEAQTGRLRNGRSRSRPAV